MKLCIFHVLFLPSNPFSTSVKVNEILKNKGVIITYRQGTKILFTLIIIRNGKNVSAHSATMFSWFKMNDKYRGLGDNSQGWSAWKAWVQFLTLKGPLTPAPRWVELVSTDRHSQTITKNEAI